MLVHDLQMFLAGTCSYLRTQVCTSCCCRVRTRRAHLGPHMQRMRASWTVLHLPRTHCDTVAAKEVHAAPAELTQQPASLQTGQGRILLKLKSVAHLPACPLCLTSSKSHAAHIHMSWCLDVLVGCGTLPRSTQVLALCSCSGPCAWQLTGGCRQGRSADVLRPPR